MNRRPTVLAAITLTTVTALCLSACGNDGKDTKTNDKITGAETGTSPSASTTSSPPPAAGRPKIELPSDVQRVVDDEKTGNKVKDAVLADSAARMDAIDAAITGTDPKGAALAYYNTGKALESALAWVAQWKKANATLTGETRYYDREVTLKGDTSAVAIYCADESKGFSKDKTTGKVAKTPVTKNSYVLYNTRLDKNADGVWQTSQVIATRGAAQCQP